ncbi:surfeit locus 1 family protein [Azospirillum soli]|nr:surfeit locus 1 family protein [Azospirillum soli]
MTMTVDAAPRRFRPSLTATLITVPAVLIMLALGTWQVQRMAWKAELIQRVEQRVTAPPVPLPATVSDPEGFEFRPVTVTGRYLHDKEMRLMARPRQGQVGYEVLTPLQRADGGGVVLVNRGFVPMDRRDPATRPESRTGGEVTVTGLVRLPHPAGWFQPENRPGADAWMRVDPPAMAAAQGLSGVAPLVVEALPDAGRSGGVLNGIAPQVELPNNHLQYAITWYSLAVTLIVIFVLSQRRRIEPAP